MSEGFDARISSTNIHPITLTVFSSFNSINAYTSIHDTDGFLQFFHVFRSNNNIDEYNNAYANNNNIKENTDTEARLDVLTRSGSESFAERIAYMKRSCYS